MKAKVIYLEDYFSGHMGDERDQHLIIVGNKNLHIHQFAEGYYGSFRNDSHSGTVRLISDDDLKKLRVFERTVLNVPEGVNEDNYSKHRTNYSLHLNFELTDAIKEHINLINEKPFNKKVLPTGIMHYGEQLKTNLKLEDLIKRISIELNKN